MKNRLLVKLSGKATNVDRAHLKRLIQRGRVGELRRLSKHAVQLSIIERVWLGRIWQEGVASDGRCLLRQYSLVLGALVVLTELIRILIRSTIKKIRMVNVS